MMRGQLEEVLKAGFVTLLLSLLCVATLATPRLSTEPDFGHSHPHSSESHLHPFKLVLGQGEGAVPVVRLEPVLPVNVTVRLATLPWVSVAVRSLHHSRAPPA